MCNFPIQIFECRDACNLTGTLGSASSEINGSIACISPSCPKDKAIAHLTGQSLWLDAAIAVYQ